MTDVLEEVSTYAGWNASLRVNGIFFDETPNNYTDTIGEYMNTIDQFVKAQSGFNGVNFVYPLFLPEANFRLCTIPARYLVTHTYLRERM